MMYKTKGSKALLHKSYQATVGVVNLFFKDGVLLTAADKLILYMPTQ